MNANTKRWMIPAAVLGAIALAAIGLQYTRSATVRARIADAVPDRPDLTSLPPALTENISRAEARATSGPERATALGELGRLYHANGFVNAAGRCYQTLLVVDPDNARWPYLLATILAGYGQLEEALPLLRRTTELEPTYAPARLKLGEVLLKLDRVAEAADAFEATLQLGPRNTFAVFGLARCAIETDDWMEARRQLQRIVRNEPQFDPAWDLLATVLEQLGQSRDATAARIRASDRSPEPPDPWIEALMELSYDPYRLTVAAATATNGGDHARAARLLERAHTLEPDNPEILLQLGKACAQLGDSVAARRHFERHLSLAPESDQGWAALVTLTAAAGDIAGAERVLRRGLEHCPESGTLHLINGRRLLEAGELEAAAAAFRLAARADPKGVVGYVELARALAALDRPQEAREQLQAALAAEPAHPDALVQLAKLSITFGDQEEAQEWLRQIELQPRVPPEEAARLHDAFRAQFGRAP